MADGGARRVVLAVDTATVVCVGLAVDGQIAASGTVDDRMAHVEQLAPLIRRVCAEAGMPPTALTDVVVGVGPGPYTGLRVGIITARVLAEVAGARLRGICSLDVLAAQHVGQRPPAGEFPAGEFIVATDARRKEVYWARYAADGARLEGPAVAKPSAVPHRPTIGPAADLYPDALAAADGPRTIDPATLALAGLELAEAGTKPLYLRRPDAVEPGRRKSVLIRGGRR